MGVPKSSARRARAVTPTDTPANTPAYRPRVRILACAGQASPRLLRALAPLGVGVRTLRKSTTPSSPLDGIRRRFLHDIIALASTHEGHITLLTGPSGSGKSTLLRALSRTLSARGCHLTTPPTRRSRARSLLDALPDSPSTLRVLGACGLADATRWVRSPCELSEGEFTRFALAHALLTSAHRNSPARHVLIIDEFTSVLDRATARALCLCIARLVRNGRTPGLRLFVATSHDDVARWLMPDATVQCSLDGPPIIHTRASIAGAP